MKKQFSRHRMLSGIIIAITFIPTFLSPAAVAPQYQGAAFPPLPAAQIPPMPAAHLAPAAPPIVPGQGIPGGAAFGPQLTLEDLQAMEQFVEEERAKMLPEVRAKFDQDVEVLKVQFEKMQQEDPEGFAKYIDSMLFGQDGTSPLPEEPIQPENPAAIAAPAPVTVEEAPRSLVDQEKQEAALRRINAIIKHTHSFLNKTAVMIEFPGKLKKWADQGKIRGWIPSYRWESEKNNVGIKEQLENMIQKLTAIKERDRATKTYKYLDQLIKNETLYNNLGLLERKLKELEPQIEIDEKDGEPVSKEVRAVMRAVLGDYLHALFVSFIPAELDAVIAGFEPTAKKYREEEEGVTKRALEESRRVRPPQGTVVAGAPEADYYPGGASGGVNPYDYFPYAGSNYQAPSSFDYAAPSHLPAEKPKREEEKKDGIDKGNKGSESIGKSKETEEDTKIKRAVDNFEGYVSSAASSIESKDIDGAVTKLKKATGELNKMKVKLSKAPEASRKKMRSQVSDIMDDYKETLDSAGKISAPAAPSEVKSKNAATASVSPANALPPAPVKKVVTLSADERNALRDVAGKLVDTEIAQHIKKDVADAQLEHQAQEARHKKAQEDAAKRGEAYQAPDEENAPEVTSETYTAFYDAQKPKMVDDTWNTLMKERQQVEQFKEDEEYKKAKDAWDAQQKAAKSAGQVDKQEAPINKITTYSVGDLTNAIAELRKAHKAL